MYVILIHTVSFLAVDSLPLLNKLCYQILSPFTYGRISSWILEETKEEIQVKKKN